MTLFRKKKHQVHLLRTALKVLKKEKITESLKMNKSIREAAKNLEVTHTLLINRMKKYNIDRNNL
ncbi:hypothetical protein [Sedimentibacter sp. B4]|uniref:hypothetical protein n=1 Tax=Sedimentibacter sp. B4 TaxID=304766 RepID=UPI0034D360FD